MNVPLLRQVVLVFVCQVDVEVGVKAAYVQADPAAAPVVSRTLMVTVPFVVSVV